MIEGPEAAAETAAPAPPPSSRRGRRIKLTVITGLVARGSSMLMTLVSVPLTLNYLGAERFGLWMTVTSVVSILTFADFGIGNGLLTVVAAASGRDDQAAIRRYVSSAFAILTALALVILAVFFVIVYPAVDWAHVFNVHSPRAQADAGPAIAVLVVTVAGNILTLIVPRVQLALQQGFLNNLSVTIGLFASMAALWLVASTHGSVALLIAAVTGTPILAACVNGLIFFQRNKRYRPAWPSVSASAIKQVLGTGLWFVLLQVGLSVSFASDKLIIARMLGAEAVASYSVYERVFGVGTNVMMVMLMPIWPAYAEAWIRKDLEWVKRTLRRSLLLSLAASACFAVTIAAFGPLIVSVWTRKSVPIQPLVLYCLGAWCVIQCVMNALSMLLNGLHLIRAQVIASIATACAAIPLKFLLVGRIGPAGAVLASSIAATCFSFIPFAIMASRLINDRLPHGAGDGGRHKP